MKRGSLRREPILWIAAAVLSITAALIVLYYARSEALFAQDTPAPQAPAQTATPGPGVQVTVNQINGGDEYLIYDIQIPEVSGLADADFQRSLNARIAAQIEADKADALEYGRWFLKEVEAERLPPYDCVFAAACEVKSAIGILSIKVSTFLDNGGTGLPHTVYYNVDTEACVTLALPDLFTGEAYKNRIDAVIDAAMRENPERYDLPFKGVTEETQFFVSDGRLFIAFAKYEVASGSAGEPAFEIPGKVILDLVKAEYKPIINEQ